MLDSRPITTAIGALFLLFMMAITALNIIYGQLLMGLITLCLVTMCICYLIGRWKRRYERQMSVASAFLALAMALLIVAYVEHPIIRLIMFLLALSWSFFVALGIYNVFIKRQRAHA